MFIHQKVGGYLCAHDAIRALMEAAAEHAGCETEDVEMASQTCYQPDGQNKIPQFKNSFTNLGVLGFLVISRAFPDQYSKVEMCMVPLPGGALQPVDGPAF